MGTNQYIDLFLDESREHLQAVSDQLLTLEKEPENISIVGEIFRSAHTLKGMAATMAFDDIAQLTHRMENVLDQIRNGQIGVTTELLDILLASVEQLEQMVEDIGAGGDGKQDVSDLISQFEKIGSGEAGGQTADPPFEREAQHVSVDFNEYERTVLKQAKEQGYTPYAMNIHLSDECSLKAARVFMVFEALESIGEIVKSTPSVEELEEEAFDRAFDVVLITKTSSDDVQKKILSISEIENVEISVADEAPARRASSPKNEQDNASTGNHSQRAVSKSIRVNIDRIDRLMNLFEELIIDRGQLEEIANRISDHELTETVERMMRTSNDLQDMMLSIRMVPIEQVFNRFPRMVRGLAKDLNKNINLEMIGQETELDRTVIDEIGDPLVHLIRNSIDHGIEMPEQRQARGKSPEGNLILHAYHSGNHVLIEIKDDGRGIDRDKVAGKAVEKGIVTAEKAQSMTDEEVYPLIFSSGFSTSEQISDISGRGVGLDVVKNKIESLGGHVFIESVPDEGTTFTIKLPLTLSILSTMLVQVEDETFAIPLSSIMETALVDKEDIQSVHKQKVIDFRDKVVPLVFLKEVFDIPHEVKDDERLSVVIIKKGDKMTGIVVDAFIGQKEVVLKSLGNYIGHVFAISGATILGNGQVALIIDANALIN